MPRANRYFLPGHVWHITHRCHKKEFLLKFSRDRQRWLYWLFESKKRYGLCVLNYVVTSNHIHLLVMDSKEGAIAKSIQLVAGRTGQEYNMRKQRKGAYWEDRYHATAVASDEHLIKCLVYIDMNMVRAGVVTHPEDWKHGGYCEIQNPPTRYRIIDMPVLMRLCQVDLQSDLQIQHPDWIQQALQLSQSKREERWTKSIAIENESYINTIKNTLGNKIQSQKVVKHKDGYSIKESTAPYSGRSNAKMDVLRVDNTLYWNVFSNNFKQLCRSDPKNP